MRRSPIVIPCVLLFVHPPESPAAVFRVPGDEPTIRAGIYAAAGGDTVLVADSTYTCPGNRDLDCHGKPIVVMSGNGPESRVGAPAGPGRDDRRRRRGGTPVRF